MMVHADRSTNGARAEVSRGKKTGQRKREREREIERGGGGKKKNGGVRSNKEEKANATRSGVESRTVENGIKKKRRPRTGLRCARQRVAAR